MEQQSLELHFLFAHRKRRIIESSDEETVVDESSAIIPSVDGGVQDSQTLDESQDDEAVPQETQGQSQASTPSEDDGSQGNQDDGPQGDQEGDQDVVEMERRIEDEEDHHESFRFVQLESMAKHLRVVLSNLGDETICLTANNEIV
jgi:hypothetical protein